MASSPTNPPALSSPPWTNRTKRTVALIGLALLGIALWQLADVLPIIIVALILSYILNPLTTLLERRILRFLPGRRGWAILLTFILLILLVVIVVLVVVPILIEQLQSFASELPRALREFETNLRDFLNQPLIIAGQPVVINGRTVVPLEQLGDLFAPPGEDTAAPTLDLAGAAQSFFSSVTGPTFRFFSSAFSALINTIFLLTMMFYLLKDGGRFIDAIVNITPQLYRDDVRRLFYELGEVWNAYLRGQLILSGFVAVVIFFAATLLGVPNAPILALISGVLEFVPNLGPTLAMIPAALLALFSQSSTLPFLSGVPFALVVVVVWIAIQNIQAVLITPRVLGDSLGLHPIIVIIGVIAGASIAGALGVILAAPTIASLKLFGVYFYGKLTGQPTYLNRPPEASPPTRPTLFSRLGRFFARKPAVKSPVGSLSQGEGS